MSMKDLDKLGIQICKRNRFNSGAYIIVSNNIEKSNQIVVFRLQSEKCNKKLIEILRAWSRTDQCHD